MGLGTGGVWPGGGIGTRGGRGVLVGVEVGWGGVGSEMEVGAGNGDQIGSEPGRIQWGCTWQSTNKTIGIWIVRNMMKNNSNKGLIFCEF